MDLALEALSAIERSEVKLLSWGLIDGSFDEDELLDAIQEAIDVAQQDGHPEAADADPEDLLEESLARLLVVRAPEQPGRYRSRMAETLRLVARLRQLFSKHENGGWATAPRLIADFRLAIQPRRYPTRDLSVDRAIDALGDELGRLDADLEAAVRAVLADRGSRFALSSFQIDAAASILRAMREAGGGATMVTAGTGSGKTLAFYLPVLASIAASAETAGPQALAIYPRNELLKDQLSQTYIEARRLDGRTASQRPLSIGAFFGPSPQRHTDRDEWLERDGWNRHGTGRACPYLRCPREGCPGPMVWSDADREAGSERLACVVPGCGSQTTPETLPLTRERMRRTPPDILFTSTEMLNRNLSSWEHRRVFGLQTPHPRIALIDEAHTYSGVAGAQVAMLLRRWHAAAGGTVHFVGLSATLVDAADFFARLTGVRESSVTLVEPSSFDEEGMEYQVALRGDPAAGTALLSTTIQTLMVARRMLDPLGQSVSDGAYGEKLFAFTDDLDVTNRLYHALRDAEALGPYRQERKPGAMPLAALRATDKPDVELRRSDGQSWDVSEKLGHDLTGETLLHISRTSSQDAGVSERSDMIVATASLEVGFNDPGVGAVVQHKAPRDEAAFLQRRGRAGRTRAMRPWTFVSLSDFGRDRLAYEAYDILFDPSLRPRPLPIANRAVLRMQATYSWMDWCSRRLAPSDPAGSVWRDLAGPGGNRSTRERQAALAGLIEQTLEDEATLLDLTAHLRRSLGLLPDQIDTVLWEPPRSLMTAVLPTALRRLGSRWYHPTRGGGGEDRDFRSRYDPLPDFVPPSLFSELTLPEVQVVTPPQNRRAEEEEHAVPILQAMRTFAPGNVSLRFAVERRGARSWIPAPSGDLIDVNEFLEHSEPLGVFRYAQTEAVRDVRVVRPWRLRASVIPTDVNDSSGGRLRWHTQILAGTDPHLVRPPTGSPWARLITGLEFHTHGRRSPATVRRFATGGDFSLLRRSGTAEEGSYEFIEGGEPIGLGFELDVDGFAVRVVVPDRCAPDESEPLRLRGFRSALFSHRVGTDRRLDGLANSFKRAQLEQVYIASLSDLALREQIDLQEAWQQVHAGDPAEALVRTAHALFDAAVPASDAQDENEERRGLDRLLDLLRDEAVGEVLRDSAPALWESPSADWEEIARDRLRATLAAGIAAACAALGPEFSTDEVIVDLDSGVQPDGSIEKDVIWVTERTVGGGGLVEELHRRCAENPRRLFSLLSRALDPSDFEVVDHQLPRALDLVCEPGQAQTAVDALRDAATQRARQHALEAALSAFRFAGLDTRHAVVAAINARLIRPGANSRTDAGLRQLVEDWMAAEDRLGIDLEPRSFAVHCRSNSAVDDAFPAGHGAGPGWRFGQILGLLWPHGWRARAEALQAYNEFSPHPPSDRLGLATEAQETSRLIPLSNGWRDALEEALAQEAVATLTCDPSRPQEAAEVLASIGTFPIDTGALLLYPWVESVRHETGRLHIRIAVEAPAT